MFDMFSWLNYANYTTEQLRLEELAETREQMACEIKSGARLVTLIWFLSYFVGTTWNLNIVKVSVYMIQNSYFKVTLYEGIMKCCRQFPRNHVRARQWTILLQSIFKDRRFLSNQKLWITENLTALL